MNIKYSEAERSTALDRIKKGETIASISSDTGVPRSTIYVWVKNYQKANNEKEQQRYINHLNQQFTMTRPNEVWVGDVTYYRFKGKSYYISAILDLYARRIISCKVGQCNSTQLVKSTFRMAYEKRRPQLPLTFHSDRGSNYRANAFCAYLKDLGVTQSFSRTHTPYDNSVMESFFSNLKREELYRTKYRSENKFRAAIERYLYFYNEQRPHVKNGYKTPSERESDYYAKDAALTDKAN